MPAVFHLRHGVTTIGSDPANDIVLEGLDPHHAEIRRNADDEYVVVHLGRSGRSRLNGEPVRERILRTGARLEVGEWTMVYAREEYADHGRPYGGRVGGEVGHQKAQPRCARSRTSRASTGVPVPTTTGEEHVERSVVRCREVSRAGARGQSFRGRRPSDASTPHD